MIIDLYKYGKEFGYWMEALKPFLDPTYPNVLDAVLADLETGREDRPRFPWFPRKPIFTRPTTAYDGMEKGAYPVRIAWKFDAEFRRLGHPKQREWEVLHLVTRFCVLSASEEDKDRVLLDFHYDRKNERQLGPHSHMQVSEAYLEEKKKVPLAVPRFPSAVLLPTDCLDLVLAEFFPHEWPKSQAELTGIGTLRSAQRDRAVMLAKALCDEWDRNPKLTPIAKTQNCFMPKVRLA